MALAPGSVSARQIGLEMWSPDWLDDGVGLAVLLDIECSGRAVPVANIRLPGMILAAVGMTLNVIVIAANGAMPVSQRALDKAGYEGELGDFDRSTSSWTTTPCFRGLPM